MIAQTQNIRKLSREERGKLIFERGRIAKKNDFWVVGSQTSFKAYKVRIAFGAIPTACCGSVAHIYSSLFL